MQRADEKTTVPNPSAATDGEQPFFKEPDASIADFPLPDNEDFQTISFGVSTILNFFRPIPCRNSTAVSFTANRRSSKICSIRVHICLPVRRKSASHFS